MTKVCLFTLSVICMVSGAAMGVPLEKGKLTMDTIAKGQWRFGGELGSRIDGNVENWLLRMPGANPGVIEMFHRRDRFWPYQEIVPWAGEFAGKYLISAVQACRMTDDKRVKPFVQDFVNQLIACQAENGYLGPWPTAQQLKGQWDLWGHYHCMLGLLMWYDDTGDQKAYDCLLRAADCICALYVDGGRRPIEAGSPPMNLSALHIFGELYRRTENPRYIEMCRRIEEDLAKDGDWLKKGEEGVSYYQLPGSGPRWESLHIVQGFLNLYRATGEERYKKSLVSLWNSIRQYDRHPSGAFSSNEGASGTVFAKGSIETCCSVAWMALSIDALRLTSDPTVADEIEMTLWNQALGAQHPSGNWCTYDTPLNGVRAPSYHQINFQYRPSTPELNCCSVNSSRTLGMLSEWAVMQDDHGLAVNFYGPSAFDLPLRDGNRIKLVQKTKYPIEGTVRIEIGLEKKMKSAIRLRVPAWSRETSVKVNGTNVTEPVKPGAYVVLDREWKNGDAIELAFDMTPRYMAGGGPDRGGCAAISVGPLLLAFDAGLNAIETKDLKPINVADLRLEPAPVTMQRDMVHFPPMGLWKVATDGGDPVLLCDFASAGAHGTDYAAWVPASHMQPAPTMLKSPVADAVGAPGSVLFRWTPTGAPNDTYELVIAKDPEFKQVVAEVKGIKGTYTTVTNELAQDGAYFWKVRTANAFGAVDNKDGARTFRVDRAAPQPFVSIREDGLVAASGLDGDGKPSCGVRTIEEGLAPAADRNGNARGALKFNGPGSRLRYALPFFPERDYTFCAWVCPEGVPTGNAQQIFSAWCRGMDDPLRVTVDKDTVSARIEAGTGFATPGAKIENGKWIHVAAVKGGKTLTLYVNGKDVQKTEAPEFVRSQSAEMGIGCNPLYAGDEYFVGKIDDFVFYAKALSADEIAKAFAAK